MKKSIHIEKLQIRLPKSAAGAAGKLAKNLGDEVLKQLADCGPLKNGARHIGEIDAGRVENSGGDLARRIAERIADAVGERTK